jgi:hypothetical protein
MELMFIIALICLGVAAQPFAARRLTPGVQSVLGSVCIGVSLLLTMLVGSGLVQLPQALGTGLAFASLPDVDKPQVDKPANDEKPAADRDASPSEAFPQPVKPAEPAKQDNEPAVVPNDESKFFAPPQQTQDEITIETDDDTVIIPPGRPMWVGQAPQLEGSIHSVAVCSDPYATHQQAVKALERKMEDATEKYITDYLHSKFAANLIHYDVKDIKRQLLTPSNVYHEKITVSIGPMHQVHALLEFKPDFREQLDQRWGEMRATYRLAETGLISGGVLLVLATIFGYFRLDNATRGYYTSRLQFMAAAAILAIVASSAMISKWWIYWV